MIEPLLQPLLSRSWLTRPQPAFSGDSEAPSSQQPIFSVVCGVFECYVSSYDGNIIIFGSHLNNRLVTVQCTWSPVDPIGKKIKTEILI